MATHSSTIAWKIPWTEELGRLQSMGLQRVGHDWATSLSLSLFTQSFNPVNTNINNLWIFFSFTFSFLCIPLSQLRNNLKTTHISLWKSQCLDQLKRVLKTYMCVFLSWIVFIFWHSFPQSLLTAHSYQSFPEIFSKTFPIILLLFLLSFFTIFPPYSQAYCVIFCDTQQVHDH